MENKIHLEIVTPTGSQLDAQVDSITIPGTLGSFQILPKHAPLLSSFEIGIVKIKTDGQEKLYATSGGTVEVKNNHVIVLAESFESEDDIDVDRALAAYRRAKERLEAHEKDIDIARAEAALARALNRLKLKKVNI
jgi:F-type H+-transporting ATPase subunit epsilon